MCLVEGCDAPKSSKGMCHRHYMRWKRHGSATAGGASHDVAAKMKWIDEVMLSDTDDCIDFPWAKEGTYGRVSVDGTQIYAHATVCARAHGPRPDGMEAAHSCGRPSCANPRHLSWKTPAENAADKLLHGTHAQGERNGNRTLDWDAVAEIRAKYAEGASQRSLGREYGVSQTQIWKIVTMQAWVLAAGTHQE
jgi:hypothetical protein